MITEKRVRKWLTASPFQPFRIFLSDGSYHDVPHPEFGWIFGLSIFVGETLGTNGHSDYDVKELSLLHVSRIEKLRAPKSNKSSN